MFTGWFAKRRSLLARMFPINFIKVKIAENGFERLVIDACRSISVDSKSERAPVIARVVIDARTPCYVPQSVSLVTGEVEAMNDRINTRLQVRH